MPCDRQLKPKQTIQQRADEIRKAVERLAQGLATGKIKPKVGPQGAIAFEGFDAKDRDGVTDNCAYRRLLGSGSSVALAALARAEALAGRPVDKQLVGQGVHGHDDGHGGITWHTDKG